VDFTGTLCTIVTGLTGLGATPPPPTTTGPTPPAAIPAYMSLAAQYGLSDMDFQSSEDVQGQTVEQEYQSYVTAALSKPGTDMLKFWEVSNAN
jgi:hypothetical protein